MQRITRTLAACMVLGLVAVACTSSGGAAPATSGPVDAAAAPPSAVAVAAATPNESAPPPASPTMTDGQGDEHVSGFISNPTFLTPDITTTGDLPSGMTERHRDGVVALTFKMNDERVNGTGHWAFSLDVYDTVGAEWGTMELTNEHGAWTGPCTGGAWADGDGIVQSCWLTGSADYDGWTYFMAFTGPANGDGNGNGTVEGVVYPGSPPAP